MAGHAGFVPSFFLCCCSGFVLARGANITLTSYSSRTEFFNALLTDYNREIPPMFDEGKACDVRVSVYVNNLNSLKEINMEFTTNLVLQQQWHDRRLAYIGVARYPYMELDNRLQRRLWVPDLFFVNEKQPLLQSDEKESSLPDMTASDCMMHLYTNGTIVHKTRITVTADCPMDLKNYPMDRQLCSLLIQSFGFTNKTLALQWAPDPIVFNPQIQLPQFDVIRHSVAQRQRFSSDVLLGNFTCLQIDFYLQRNLAFYLLNLYVPSCLAVILSWLSFWLHPRAVSGRTSVGILTVLTITAQSTNAVESLPKVPYIKAIDIWMAACLFFAFAAFLQYAVVCVTDRAHYSRHSITASWSDCGLDTHTDTEVTNGFTSQQSIAVAGEINRSLAMLIDKVCRVVFPVVFVLFAVLYSLYFTYYAEQLF